MKRFLFVACITATLILAAAASGMAKTTYVKPDGTGDVPTIAQAMSISFDGDIVLLGPGTFTGQYYLHFYGRAITVMSEMGLDQTIIRSPGPTVFRFLNGEGAGSVLSGVTITGTSGYPAVLCNGNVSPTISGNKFIANSSGQGAAIFCEAYASPTIRGNTFESNTAGAGGAIYARQYSTAIIEGNTFTGNSVSAYGGGIYAESATLIDIKDNVFLSNVANSRGGGIYIAYGNGSVTNNTFVENRAGYGGGMASNSDRSTIGNNTFTRNSAMSGQGAALWLSGGPPPPVEYNIFAFNHSGTPVYCIGSYPVITCCDFYGNQADNTLPYGSIDGGGNIFENPMFCGFDDFTLDAASPCTEDNHPYSVLIGAWGVGCGVVPAEPTTWGHLKSLYGD